MGEGYDKLWCWFGLSRASFLIIPRVMLHEMDDEWQGKLADLLNEADQQWMNSPSFNLSAQLRGDDGKIKKMPEALTNYRHPDKGFLKSWRTQWQCKETE